jgi:predicted transcriptional regulator
MAMTEREFFTKVLATEGLAEDLKSYATEGIAKLDARNDKRKNTQTKAQKENAETMVVILDTIKANGKMVASEIATALNISTQKASALCKLLVNEGKLAVGEVKVKNKGAIKQYSLVTPTAEEPSAED